MITCLDAKEKPALDADDHLTRPISLLCIASGVLQFQVRVDREFLRTDRIFSVP